MWTGQNCDSAVFSYISVYVSVYMDIKYGFSSKSLRQHEK